VLSAANRVFAAELCCPQRIGSSLLNCVVRSESGVRCRIGVVGRESGVAVNSCCPQRIRCSLLNGVVRSESGVRCRMVLSAANQGFAAELCCPQ
jgi:hypothetical protein